MSEPLTNIQEPGFFSQVQESPSLSLAPATIEVIGIIGEGSITKPVTASLARNTALDIQPVGVAVSSADTVYSAGVFKYPASSYGFAIKGTDTTPDLALTGLSLKLTVGSGAEQSYTFASDPADLAAAIALIEANFDGISAFASAGALLLVAVDGQALSMGAGTANVNFGFTDGALASDIWWDSAITDSELAPQNGTAYSLDIQTPKLVADFGVKYFTAAPQVYALYGDPVVGNTISLAAYAAFNAPGASALAIRQLNPANYSDTATKRAEINLALQDMEAASISVLVPMIPANSDPLTIPLYLQHVSKMSSKLERKERIAILGVDETASQMPILGTGSWTELMAYLDVPATSGLQAKRIMVLAPGQVSALLRNSNVTLDGTYMAAALAGRMVASEFDVATSMTRKTLATIDGMASPERLRSEKNQLTGMGVTVVEMKSGIATVRRAISADTSSIASEEPSITRSFDRIAADLREYLENRFIGSKIIPNVTSTALEAAVQSYLNDAVASEVIGGFRSIKATQNAQEPRQFDISFEAVPVYPFLWGFVDISIALS